MNKEISKTLYNFLSPSDKQVKADLIIGFGHFDLRIPEQCLSLLNKGLASRILFTGGVGAGSADFKNPEAVEFYNYIKRDYPKLAKAHILIEKESTNTGENLAYSIKLLKETGLLEAINNIILVATPTRQLRVFLTAKKYFPDMHLINLPPVSSYDNDLLINEKKGIDFKRHLIGELDRIITYPKLGYASSTTIPTVLKNINRNTVS